MVMLALLPLEPAPADQSLLGELRIASADAPPQVPRSYDFSFSFAVRYATHGPVKVYSGVYEGREGDLRRAVWRSPDEDLKEGGVRIYRANLKSPPADTLWRLTVYVFFLEETAWKYAKDERGPGFKEIQITVANSAKVRVETSVATMEVLLDGSSLLTNNNGTLEVQVPIFTLHTLELHREFSKAPGTRSVLIKWADGLTDTKRNFNATGPMSFGVNYKTQYSMVVVSDFGEPWGQGWYDAGSVAEYGVQPNVPFDGVLGLLGAIHVFQEWTGDSSAHSPTARAIMDKPRQVRAVWASNSLPAILNAVTVALVIFTAFASLRLMAYQRSRKERRKDSSESSRREPDSGESPAQRAEIYWNRGTDSFVVAATS